MARKPRITVNVCPYYKPPPGVYTVDTCSHSNTWSKGLSPFVLGPVNLYGGYVSQTMENAWQYSKVYAGYSQHGEPTQRYFLWAQKGWNNPRAVRYPMGKGAKPLFSYWDGESMDYVTARKRIYCPLYANAVEKTDAFARLYKIAKDKGEIWLRDFDGYDYRGEGKTLEEVLNDPNRKMGHAFVLAMLLTGQRLWEE